MTPRDPEASYRLSPMQEGMLFHYLQARTSGVDIEQLVCTLHEAVQTDALAYAWTSTVERHAVMRTSFQWENSPKPFQNVQDRVDLPFELVDLDRLPHDLQEQELEQYLDRDRSAGFELDRAPLMRVALFRLSEKHYKLVWTFHHAILDGRSFHIVLNELFSIYDARIRGQELQLPPLRPYSDYIEWLDTLELSQAEAFWRHTLKGFQAATPLPAKDGSEPGSGSGEEEFHLSEEATESLRALAVREGITLNTIVQGAWALLLSRYSGAKDVVFGATRACRSFSKDAASMVGTFINTLPVRAAVSEETPLLPWLREIRAAQIAAREFENAPLAMIQSWSDIAHGTPLFESILIFENYLLHSKMQSEAANWTGREVYLLERTNYPLALYGYAEPGLILRIAYDKERFDAASVARMLGQLRTLLEAIAAGTNLRIADLPILTADEKQELLEDWNRTGSDMRARSGSMT